MIVMRTRGASVFSRPERRLSLFNRNISRAKITLAVFRTSNRKFGFEPDDLALKEGGEGGVDFVSDALDIFQSASSKVVYCTRGNANTPRNDVFCL